MLQYIVYILADYEKEANKLDNGCIYLKNFKYPPVLPIVFYDGADKWTAARHLEERTDFSNIFGKYIPKFDYELVSLNDYTENDLIKLGDVLSYIMIIDKIRKADELDILKRLPDEYKQRFHEDMPDHLKELIANVIMVLLRRLNFPDEEIEKITEPIYKRKVHTMFEWIEDYDVQETRRVARGEGVDIGVDIGVELAGDIIVALKQGLSVEAVAKKLKTSIETVNQLKEKIS
jgi:hypothetical protein